MSALDAFCSYLIVVEFAHPKCHGEVVSYIKSKDLKPGILRAV